MSQTNNFVITFKVAAKCFYLLGCMQRVNHKTITWKLGTSSSDLVQKSCIQTSVFCLILQKSIFRLIFSIVSKLWPKQCCDFLFLIFLTCKRLYPIPFINIRTLTANCVWTTMRIDFKFLADLQIFQKYCFWWKHNLTKSFGS